MLAHHLELRGEHLAVFEGWPCGEGGEGFGWGRASDGELVLFVYLGGRVSDSVRQSAVVGQDQEARGGGVQAAYGDEAG